MYNAHLCLVVAHLLDYPKLREKINAITDLGFNEFSNAFYTYAITRSEQTINGNILDLLEVQVDNKLIFSYDLEGKYNYQVGDELLYLYLSLM